MTRLYLMRHGETVDNAAQLMQGQTQGQLNETGIKQAEQAGKELATYPFDAIISSDLKRAVDTARIVAQHHGLPVVTTPLLRERDWGDFTGRFIPDLKGLPFPDNVEQLDQLLSRARQFLHYIYKEYSGQTVLAVGHGIINKAIQAVYYDCGMKDVPRMTNAEVRLLELNSDY
ncbi:MAG: histidine phosphatase family protein [Prevotella sp.]|nr:histidine phosphatase family protein [Prevotella sp.]